MRALPIVAFVLAVTACSSDDAGPVAGADVAGSDLGAADATGGVDVELDTGPGPDAPHLEEIDHSGDASEDAGPDPADGAGGEVTEVPSGIVRFVTPDDGAVVSGVIHVALEPIGFDERKVESLTVWAGETLLLYDTKLPTDFWLDTRQHAGPLELVALATAAGVQGGDVRAIDALPAPLDILEATPDRWEVANGETVTITVRTTVAGADIAADLTGLDSGFAPAALGGYALGGDAWVITYTVTEGNTRPDGRYAIPITATVGPDTVMQDTLELDLRNLPPLPLRVTGGIFVPGALPVPSATWGAPAPGLTTPNPTIVTGGSAKVDADFTGAGGEPVGLIVGLEGYAGHYQIPLADPDGTEELLLQLRTFEAVGDPVPPVLPIRVGVRNAQGEVSSYGNQLLSVQAVGSGDIQVSISWDTPTDVDLHVIEPGGCEMYYGSKTCASGGFLDLDSNPGCSLDNVNNENVFWPDGQAPPGTYTVKVDFFEDCCSCGAQYTVTINYCGKTEVHEGSFAPDTDDFGGAGSGVLVTTFNNEQCLTRLRGRVRYQDRTFDELGFRASTWRPVRYGRVEVRRLADGELLGQGATDRLGRYEIAFTNDGDPAMVLRVFAETDVGEGLRDIRVLNHPKFKQLYSVASPPIVPPPGEQVTVANLDIGEELDAGAFNIFDVLVDGYDRVRLTTGGDLGTLDAYWATGADTTDTLYCSSYFYDLGVCTEKGALSVQGKDTDRDEYDDMVILGELFKFALDQLGRDDNPGGEHDGTRDDPRRAWSEGVSAFFACDVMGSRHHVNSRPQGVYLVRDVELAGSPFAFGTGDGALAGPVSEYLVTALLWDLADAGGAEVYDAIEGLSAGVYDVIFNRLPDPSWTDRAAVGVDLVDFLDGWRCRGWSSDEDLQPLAEQRQFPYDFPAVTSCEPSVE